MGDKNKTRLWEPVLNSIEPWTEYVRVCTNDTVANICFAMVPFVEHFTLEQRAPEIYALDTLARWDLCASGWRGGP